MNAAEAAREGSHVEKGAAVAEGGAAKLWAAPEPLGEAAGGSGVGVVEVEGGGEVGEGVELFIEVVEHLVTPF